MTQPGIGRLKLPLVTVFLCILGFVSVGRSQSTSATISGTITDQSGAFVVGADVIVTAEDTGFVAKTKTNSAGVYSVPDLKPGPYRVTVAKEGFRQVAVRGITLNVQDVLNRNFTLQLGSFSEVVEVQANGLNVNTTDASVSTVVNRNFAENIPMNGRSFQTLIELTPGVVALPAGANHGQDSGQFSINGQRGDANYWMVDGVSANAGSVPSNLPANQLSGSIGVGSAWGGTNSLVSVDALQEFRIQTSTFAPEFGRTPGGQISIVTRSGTNAFHGTAFDYLRNDILDANNWFNGYTNPKPLPKAEERQNDFGGTFSGPILKNRTFFFFSYEGLRLRLPTTLQSTVPDLPSRQSALPAVQPYLNAYPVPNGPEIDSGGDPFFAGQAQFVASFSNPGTLNAYSLRVDHNLTDRFILFGRYNYSPSETGTRGSSNFNPLSDVFKASTTAQQGTVGLNGTLSTKIANEFRFNYSRSDSSSISILDNFHGAVPVTAALPSPYTEQTGNFSFFILSLINPSLQTGPTARQLQQQWNVVNTVSAQEGSHSLKFGIDYRRLTPFYGPAPYTQSSLFLDVPSAQTGSVIESDVILNQSATFLFRNLSLFAQDTWRVRDRLTVTYGLRWDTDFSPESISGPSMVSVAGFNPSDLSNISFVSNGTPPFKTNFRNFAPRAGAAYQVSQRANWGLVARGGVGVFYDLATSEAGNLLGSAYPFTGPDNSQNNVSFPLSPQNAAAPPIAPPTAASPGVLLFFDPSLKSPYTVEWNTAIEQGLGEGQSLSLTYVGAAGRRLTQSTVVPAPIPSLLFARFVDNSATSDYDALQVRFERRLVKNLQVLSSYSWSHSTDTGSAGSADYVSNASSGIGDPGNRGPSAFDVRHAFSLGSTYVLPSLSQHLALRAITRGWSLQNIFEAHTGLPVDVELARSRFLTTNLEAAVRPDILPGIPLYLYGSQYPGGRAFNSTPGAGTCADGSPSVGPFCNPPVNANGIPLRQGTLGRNALRGFDLFQWNMGVHRDFPLHETVALQFRAEMFNILNHPNFAPPSGSIGVPGFGLSSETLANYLGSGAGSGGFNSLYQAGGPRSVQLALKLNF